MSLDCLTSIPCSSMLSTKSQFILCRSFVFLTCCVLFQHVVSKFHIPVSLVYFLDAVSLAGPAGCLSMWCWLMHELTQPSLSGLSNAQVLLCPSCGSEGSPCSASHVLCHFIEFCGKDQWKIGDTGGKGMNKKQILQICYTLFW